MSATENRNIPIYFYYLTVGKIRNGTDEAVYNMQDISAAFSNVLSFICEKELINRSIKFESIEKVIWLDSFNDLSNGNYNLIFKSAKYNHVRNEIDTETMEVLGQRKRPQDGDEEKTHLCIHLNDKRNCFLAVHESNHYGISISSIVYYLNEMFSKYNEEKDDKNYYKLTYDIVPGDDFLTELRKAKSISFVKLTIEKSELNNPFLQFAGRVDISKDVEITIRRPKGAKNFPENLIKAYYDNMQEDNKIRKIYVEGSRYKGKFEASTDLIKMKHFLIVNKTSITNEVDSTDFFQKAQVFVDEEKNRK
jgi:hypothetical protein